MRVIILLTAIIAVEGITEALLHSELFDKPRDWLSIKSRWLARLMSCGWCLSFWVSVFAILLMVFGLWYLLLPFAVQRFSNYLHDLYGIVKRHKR